MRAQDLAHLTPDVVAHWRRCIVIEINMAVETDQMFQEFEVLDFHFCFLFYL
jgi:hypothetical protein